MLIHKLRTFILLGLLAVVVSFAPVARRGVAGGVPQKSRGAQKSKAGEKKPPAVVHGFDVANLDRSANACVDFNAFANGGWMAAHPVPPAYARWGKFEELAEKNQEVLHSILEDAARKRNAPAG